MGMVAALWDVLAKAANLAQMSGLHAVMLVAAGASIMRIPQSKRECAKLERCSRRLHALLEWPTDCGAALLSSELGGPVVQALVDAAGLVDSYNRSTLWRRVRSGRSMANQLRDMRDVVDSYYGLLLFINAAHLHLLQHPTPPPRSTDNPSAVTNCPTVTTGTSDAQRTNDIVIQTCNTTDLVGSERNVPASGSDFPCITVQGGDCSHAIDTYEIDIKP